jgi:hypothetical protein
MPGDLPQFEIAPLRHPAQRSERLVGGDLQALHQDAFCLADDGAG